MNWTVKTWFVQDFKGHSHDTDEWRDYDEDNALFERLDRKGVCLEQRMNIFHGQLLQLSSLFPFSSFSYKEDSSPIFCFRNPVRTWRCEIFFSDSWQLLTWSIYHQDVVFLFSREVFGRICERKMLPRNVFMVRFCRLLFMQNLFFLHQQLVVVLVARIPCYGFWRF